MDGLHAVLGQRLALHDECNTLHPRGDRRQRGWVDGDAEHGRDLRPCQLHILIERRLRDGRRCPARTGIGHQAVMHRCHAGQDLGALRLLDLADTSARASRAAPTTTDQPSCRRGRRHQRGELDVFLGHANGDSRCGVPGREALADQRGMHRAHLVDHEGSGQLLTGASSEAMTPSSISALVATSVAVDIPGLGRLQGGRHGDTNRLQCCIGDRLHGDDGGECRPIGRRHSQAKRL